MTKRAGSNPVIRPKGKRYEAVKEERVSLLDRLERVSGLRWVLVIPALILTTIGLIMVLSASSVEAITSGGSSYDLFMRQSVWAVAALVCLIVTSIMPIGFLKKLAWPAVGISVLLLILVAFTPLGVEVKGNRNWLDIGGMRAQPSEAVKLALSLWMGVIFSNKGSLVRHWVQSLIPVVFPVGLILIGLVMYGRDLGTGVILSLILMTGLVVAGSNWKLIAGLATVGAIGAVLITLLSSNRMSRVHAWLGQCDDLSDSCYQSQHGLSALASGGWFGLGLGQSRQKWSYIPEAENDFIISIVGEEMGFLFTVLIIMLFSVIALTLYLGARRAHDTFSRVVLMCIMVWIAGQAFVNIAMVTGILPVIGVPLPFISYGGSALTMSLIGIGVAAAIIRDQEVKNPRALSVKSIFKNKKSQKITSGTKSPRSSLSKVK